MVQMCLDDVFFFFISLIQQTPRSCDDYWSEFLHCVSLWNRFHHYYSHGTFLSCQQWKKDYRNCKEWEKHRSADAKVQLCLFRERVYEHLEFLEMKSYSLVFIYLQEALLKSERCRLEEQRRFIPVWQLRQHPPKDWHLPLNQERPQDS